MSGAPLVWKVKKENRKGGFLGEAYWSVRQKVLVRGFNRGALGKNCWGKTSLRKKQCAKKDDYDRKNQKRPILRCFEPEKVTGGLVLF